MRLPVSLALVALALATAVDAQMDFTQAYQVRAGFGDLPSTPVVERAGSWNVEQRLAVAQGAGNQTLRFTVPAGGALEAVSCTCPAFQRQEAVGAVTVTLPGNATAAAPATVTVLSSQPFSTAVAFSLRPPAGTARDAAVVLFVPRDSTFQAPGQATSPGTSTSGTSTIHAISFDAAQPMPEPFWAVVHPGAAAAGPADGEAGGFPWLPVLAALALGALLWALLVQRGLVQARGRKQVAQAAAHQEIAAQDPPAVLEGKKRALLAALKEVELARQAQEMDVPTYDAVKAEFKKQAVTVMRALETGTGDKA